MRGSFFYRLAVKSCPLQNPTMIFGMMDCPVFTYTLLLRIVRVSAVNTYISGCVHNSGRIGSFAS